MLETETIVIDDIHKEYRRGRVRIPVLRGVSLTIRRGEMVALMGASGSGKTTLINLVGGFDRPTSGRYWLDGEELATFPEDSLARLRNRKVGFVFQNFNLLARQTALENVMMPLAYALPAPPAAECRACARALLERVGLGDRLDHEPSQLSGGEQQRVAIARALVNRCELLIADEPTGNLDSSTGEEILELFRRLHEEDGLTILLVTHDPSVASHADRIIRIRDGLICEDAGTDGTEAPEPPRVIGEARPPRETRHRHVRRRRPGLRSLAYTVATALRCLRRNAMRSALTTLGIVIGVAALIAIAEIGQGSARAIRAMLTETGVDNILVQSGAASRNGVSLGRGSIKTLTPEDSEAILRECPTVAGLAPIVYGRGQVVRGNRNWNPRSLYGTTPGFLAVRDWEDLAEGEPFTERDIRDVAMVCLLGRTIARELFGDESPVGLEVDVNGVPLQRPRRPGREGGEHHRRGPGRHRARPVDDGPLSGQRRSRRQNSGRSASSPANPTSPGEFLSRRYPRGQASLYPNTSTIQEMDSPRLERSSNIDTILVRSRSTEEIPAAMRQISELLRERHRIRPGDEDDFAVRDFTEIVRAVQATIGLVTGLLMCVALISLLVGGVGIMNIMLVSVTERYREIGLRHGGRRHARRHPPAVPGRGRRPLPARRRRRHPGGTGGIAPGPDAGRVADGTVAAGGRRIGVRLRHRGDHLRLLPGLEGLTPQPHRGPEVRMKSPLHHVSGSSRIRPKVTGLPRGPLDRQGGEEAGGGVQVAQGPSRRLAGRPGDGQEPRSLPGGKGDIEMIQGHHQPFADRLQESLLAGPAAEEGGELQGPGDRLKRRSFSRREEPFDNVLQFGHRADLLDVDPDTPAAGCRQQGESPRVREVELGWRPLAGALDGRLAVGAVAEDHRLRSGPQVEPEDLAERRPADDEAIPDRTAAEAIGPHHLVGREEPRESANLLDITVEFDPPDVDIARPDLGTSRRLRPRPDVRHPRHHRVTLSNLPDTGPMPEMTSVSSALVSREHTMQGRAGKDGYDRPLRERPATTTPKLGSTVALAWWSRGILRVTSRTQAHHPRRRATALMSPAHPDTLHPSFETASRVRSLTPTRNVSARQRRQTWPNS